MRLGIDDSHLRSKAHSEVAPIYSPQPGESGLSGFSDEQLVAVIHGSVSWAEVAAKLSLPTGGWTWELLRIAAARLNADTTSMLGQAWGRSPVQAIPVPFNRGYDVTNLHKVGAAAAMQWFLSRGYMVSLPIETATYDLVVESDDGLKRVQVKTTRGGDRVGITKTQYGNGTSPSAGRYGVRAYTEAEVDLFFVYCGDGSCYLIPLEAVRGMTALGLPKYENYKLEK
jgi:hypothetical protein